MKPGKIVLYENFENISPFAAFIREEKIYITGNYIEKKHALIVLNKNSTERFEISEEKIKSSIILEDSLHSLTEMYSKNLEKIHIESQQLGYELSWLQSIQILFIQMNTNQDLYSILKQLNILYKKYLIAD